MAGTMRAKDAPPNTLFFVLDDVGWLTLEFGGLNCGYDFGAPAADGYDPPFAFTGVIHSVTYDRLMAQQ